MKYGNAFDAEGKRRAPGTSHNAAKRGYANFFALATDGGTAEALMAGQIGVGCVLDSVTIETDANLSGVTFTIGTPDDPDKYGVAVAGPNAAVQTRYPPLSTKLEPTTGAEDIILTPSAAVPNAGNLRVKIAATHR